MIWPGMVFNLCLGLLVVAYLLRVLRRYEACVDAIITKLDKDQETSLRKFDAARDETRALMRTETDRSIAIMQATIEKFQAMGNAEELQDAGIDGPVQVAANHKMITSSASGTLTTNTGSVTGAIESARSKQTEEVPTEAEIELLPRWTQAAFAAPMMPVPRAGRTVLFIDDERHHLNYYIEAIMDDGLKTVFCGTAAEGLDYIRNHYSEIDVIVLDIMMPTPPGVAAVDTNDGYATGIWLLRRAKTILEGNVLPVIVLSDRNRPELERLILEQVLLPDGLIVVTTKTETSASMLPKLISKMCFKWKK